MKVLVVTNMYPSKNYPFYGIFVKEQIESLRKEGVTVDVVFINGKENRLNYFTCIKTLLNKNKSNYYDIIHAHHTYCIYPIKIVKIMTHLKTPVILTFHEGEVHRTDKLKIKDIDLIKRLVFSKKIKKIALNMVDGIIAVQQELIEALNFRGQYQIIPCGVDLDLFHPMKKEQCRKEFNLPIDKKIIFFPASPDNINKGVDILREAITYLDRKDIYLLVAGDIRHEDMPSYMCASDLVVQLSNYEASPMILKEALAVNVPVLFTGVGDVKSTVGNTIGCFLCERTPKDVALKLEIAINYKSQSEGRKRIIEAGLGLSDIAKKIIKVYENLLQTN